MTVLSVLPLAADGDLVEPVAPGWQLVVAALAAIALLVGLITLLTFNPSRR